MSREKYSILKFRCVFAFLVCGYFISAQPTLDWARQFKGTGSDEGLCIKADNAGNIYTAGYFWGLTDFDPGPAFDTLRAIGTDGFITKFNSQGNLTWVRQISGYGSQYPFGMALDDSSNIYVAGMFSGVTDFDPGPGVYNLTPVTINSSLFILKLNPSGNFVWAKQLGGDWFQDLRGMTVDKSGNVFAAGMFSANIDFDPGPGTYSLSVIDGPVNGYVLKLNNSGNFLWAKQFTGSSVNGNAIAVDAAGNVYTAGRFGGPSCDFDPGPLSYTLASQGNFEVFVNKLDKNGNFLWVKQLGSVNSDYAYALTLDQYNNVYTGGYMGNSFISKMDSLGNLKWMHSINIGSVNGLAIDGSDNVIGVGNFWGTSDFDPGPGIDSIKSSGNYDAFIVKLNSKGKYVCGAGVGGSDKDVATSVAIDNFQNICITGWFADTADFDPGPANFNLVSTAAPNSFERGNVFVAKYSSCQFITDNNIPLDVSSSISVFPNPSNGLFGLKIGNKIIIDEIQIYNMFGQRIECSIDIRKSLIDIQDEPAGNYIIRLKAEDNFFSKIIVKE
ncbi:MAG: hypothetical protein K0S53_460 [Bacteroidetes bacterium]|jgi:hypothetical protein|nr:hypothetical protein [Bacteroidota bacterium]MDF2452878.1 hypothetical protein [Bacteroidota bacterium]